MLALQFWPKNPKIVKNEASGQGHAIWEGIYKLCTGSGATQIRLKAASFNF